MLENIARDMPCYCEISFLHRAGEMINITNWSPDYLRSLSNTVKYWCYWWIRVLHATNAISPIMHNACLELRKTEFCEKHPLRTFLLHKYEEILKIQELFIA